MLILNSRKVIYVHIHKTGGETVEHLLGKLGAWNDIILDSEHPAARQEFKQRFGLSKHSTALQAAKLLGMEVWKSYFSWATIRNPYERMASLYGFVASMSEPLLSQIGFPVDGSPEVQLKWVESDEYPLKDHWAFPAVRAYLATRGSQSPFSEFLRHPLICTKEPGYQSQFSRLSNAGADALLVTRVVKLEYLSDLWPDLCREMRIPPTKLLVRNATPNKWKRSVEELFTNPADLELINTVHSEDFRRFNYATVGRDPVPRVIAATGSFVVGANSPTPNPPHSVLRDEKRALTESDALERYAHDGFEKIDGRCNPHVLTVLRHVAAFHESIGFQGSAVEIGVHYGKFFLALHNVVDGRPSLAIDVFENQAYSTDRLSSGSLARLKANCDQFSANPQNVFIEARDSLAIRPIDVASMSERIGPAQFFSINGGHTKQHVANDYRIAEKMTSQAGIIIVDDITHGGWPGVMEGVCRLYILDTPKFVPVAIGHNKLLLVGLSYHRRLLDFLIARSPLIPVRAQAVRQMFGHDLIWIS